MALGEHGVELRELAEQHGLRSAVGRDVVHDDVEHMVALGQAQQLCAEERATLEVERTL